MAKEYKIYFNERFVLFTENPDISGFEQKYLYKFENSKQIADLISTFEQQKDQPSLVIIAQDAKRAFKSWRQNIRYIKAAGGFVRNKNDESLFIFRLGKWDLPKGKLEKNEMTEHAALREVEEETGLRKLTILDELKSTYHTYQLNEVFILKRTYWYLMKAGDDSNMKPQTEENISEVKWVKVTAFNEILLNTYPAIRDVILEVSR